MAPTSNENLLAKLARGESDGSDPFFSLAASEPEHEEQEDEKLNALLARVNQKMAAPDAAPAAPDAPAEPDLEDAFVPIEPESLRQAGLTDTEVEALILKYLMAKGDASGHEVADQIRLPFVLIDEILRQLKTDQLVVHKGAALMNDYQYQAQRHGTRAGTTLLRAVQLFRLRARHTDGLHQRSHGPVPGRPKANGRSPPCRV